MYNNTLPSGFGVLCAPHIHPTSSNTTRSPNTKLPTETRNSLSRCCEKRKNALQLNKSIKLHRNLELNQYFAGRIFYQYTLLIFATGNIFTISISSYRREFYFVIGPQFHQDQFYKNATKLNISWVSCQVACFRPTSSTSG